MDEDIIAELVMAMAMAASHNPELGVSITHDPERHTVDLAIDGDSTTIDEDIFADAAVKATADAIRTLIEEERRAT